ncbi:MAG TPA: ABC-2 family transporter protein [Nitrospirota bacterium]|nr:ABC-2 family transporter protein [Nitrospirota bacterium]
MEMIALIKKYIRIWKQLSSLAIGSSWSNRIDSAAYLAGKLIRFGFFLLLIISLFSFTDNLAGYSQYEVILFFLTFNLIDVSAQALFRGIYAFRADIQRGNFDFVLSKPVNPLFYSLSRMTDILDIIFLAPIIVLIVFVMGKLPKPPDTVHVFLYSVLIVAGMIIILGIHIISAGVAIWKIESENFIWLYREAMTIGRFPPEVYSPTVRLFFTFAVPILIAVAFPVKILLYALDWRWMMFTMLYAVAFFGFSLIVWKASLKVYSSASS